MARRSRRPALGTGFEANATLPASALLRARAPESSGDRLSNAGCSTDQIKSITGHKSLSEVARYTAAADQERLAGQAVNAQIGRSVNRKRPTSQSGGQNRS
jgi:hypothetical protein